MEIREANLEDWVHLEYFFRKIYRVSHPLHTKEFWVWQFGNPEFGRSFVCINDFGQIVGHVGASFGGNISWIINVYLDEQYRGKGILSELYALARSYYPLAATAANDAGLGLYRNMRWHRYYNLVRYVKVNPSIQNPTFVKVCTSSEIEIEKYLIRDTQYFKQPGIRGLMFENKSRAISQENIGGLRVVDITDLSELEAKAWDLGYHWMDYLSSWNDLKIRELEMRGWVIDTKSIVPWRLNPIEAGYYCNVSFLSEEPLGFDFIVHRSYSDHGRIGSL